MLLSTHSSLPPSTNIGCPPCSSSPHTCWYQSSLYTGIPLTWPKHVNRFLFNIARMGLLFKTDFQIVKRWDRITFHNLMQSRLTLHSSQDHFLWFLFWNARIHYCKCKAFKFRIRLYIVHIKMVIIRNMKLLNYKL